LHHLPPGPPPTRTRSSLQVPSGASAPGKEPCPAVDDSSPRRATPAIPGYEITGELGRGGMGVVYEARDLHLNRRVALKMILAGDHADSEAIIRFLGEAEAVAQLRHPNIVQIYGTGGHEGRTYFALEYVEGGNLAQRLDGTPWPQREAARL